MIQFHSARVFEAENLAALWIDTGHHVPDGAILSGGVHRLKDQQYRITVGRVVKTLQRAQLRHLLFEEFVLLLLRLVNRLDARWPFFEADLFAFRHPEIFGK